MSATTSGGPTHATDAPARRGSLFWRFAGTFLLVLAAASAIQLLVGVAVLRPLVSRSTRDRAEIEAQAAARTLAFADSLDEFTTRRVLHAGAEARGTTALVFVNRAGVAIADRPVPGRFYGLIEQKIGMPVRRMPPVRLRPPPGPDGRPFGGPPGGPGLPPGGGPPEGGPAGSPPDAPPERDVLPGDAVVPGPPDARLGAHAAVLAEAPVMNHGGPLGTVFAVGPAVPPGLMPLPRADALLLFVPFALLAAAASALIMVRMVVGRLQALEGLAARVAEGDLTARVADTRGDEIGRLGERLDRMIERLAAAREALENTDRQRRQLFADITHELATPLTSIRGYAETLLDDKVATSPAERASYLEHVLGEAERLDALIRDLLELARLEAGAQALQLERMDWAALSRHTVERFAPRFRAAGLELRGDAARPAWIRADGRRMEQALDNLLVNALRYVPAGGTVEVRLEPGVPRHRLTVSDDGPGIAPDELPHVFDRFWRSDSVRAQSGSGLGLAIVQEIARRHGGDVRAEPNPPRGTRFVVELPAEADPPRG